MCLPLSPTPTHVQVAHPRPLKLTRAPRPPYLLIKNERYLTLCLCMIALQVAGDDGKEPERKGRRCLTIFLSHNPLGFWPGFLKESRGGAVAASWLVRSSPDRLVRVRALAGHCFVYLGKKLYSHSASLHPGVSMVPANLILAASLRWTSIPSRAA